MSHETIFRPHDEGSPTCWCHPRVTVVCPACEQRHDPDPACPACGGSGVVDATDATDPDGPYIIIHNEG